jgi:hypothetical protein
MSAEIKAPASAQKALAEARGSYLNTPGDFPHCENPGFLA